MTTIATIASTTFLLGAPDPEMAAIEAILHDAGISVMHAAVGGRRCHPGNAYKADSPAGMPDCGGGVHDAIRGVTVECGGDWPEVDVIARCDHHRPGDAGFGRPPGESLAASSLGQVICWLAGEGLLPASWARQFSLPGGGVGEAKAGDLRSLDGRERKVDHEVGQIGRLPRTSAWQIGAGSICVVERSTYGTRLVRVPADLLLVAAADHCLGAAYAGQCPGVDPAGLRRHRTAQRAAWLRGLPEDRPERMAVVERIAVDGTDANWIAAVETRQDMTAAQLDDMPAVALGGVEVIDLLAVGTLPELPEVLAMSGRCGIYRRENPHDGSVKIGIIGAGMGTAVGTAPVEVFMAAARTGSVLGAPVDPESVYGDPVRGYAGATVIG